MTSNTNSSNVCLICNASCLSSRNTIKIFDKDSAVVSEISIPVTLGRILKRDIRKDNVHSEILCKKCFKLVDEYEEIQNRMSEISQEISDNYKVNIESRQIEIDNMQESSSRENNELPKKILDIPSSDEESSQVIEKPLESLEDINMVLVKMHDAPMDDDDDMENGSQNYRPIQVNSDGEEQEPSSETGEKVTFIKVEPNVNDNSSDQNQVSHTPDTSKPNILKRRASTNGITYDSIVIQPVKLKPTEEELGVSTPIVSRDGKVYTCLLCVGDEITGEAKEIITHMKESHECRLYICDVCGMDFRKRNLLSAHVDEHVANEEGDFQCEVCNRIFTNLRLFRIHRRMHLPPAKAWSCSTCGKRFSSKNLLDEHVNMHLGVRPYVCNVCGKDFASKYTFKAHEKTHEMRPRPYRCEQCGKSFLSQQNLTQHERTHLGIKEFECHLCSKQFGSANNLEVHSIVHTGYRPFICGLCGKTFARKAEIKDHERTHTGERPYQCEFCGATFSQRSNLQSHKRATHYDDKRYRCEDCGKCFKRRRLLDYHIKAAHTGERPFKCEVCQATFVYPEHFKKHRRIHTGEKPFSCEVCGKAFNSRDNRNAHRFVHSDKKPYECLVCGAGFMRKPLLYQHMQLQGHLNDTIVVNQPRLTLENKLVMDSESHLVRVEEEPDTSESKLFIAAEDGSEHIIIDGQHITFAESTSDNEIDSGEVIDEIEQVVGTEEYEEILTSEALTGSETQIIETPDGPIQLVKVKIPNEHGEEEEAWIKIVPE